MFRISAWICKTLLAVFLLCPVLVFSANFYVDSRGGSEESDGLSAATAFRNISQLPLDSLDGDNTIHLRCGSIWYETLSLVNPVLRTGALTITSYGENCDGNNLPVIDGGFPLKEWRADPSDTTGTVFQTQSHLDAGFQVMTTQLINSDTRDRYTVARFPNESDADGAMRTITHNSVDVDARQTNEHYLIDNDEDSPYWSINSDSSPVGAELHIRNRRWILQDRIITYFDGGRGEIGWFEDLPTTRSENEKLAIEQAVIDDDCDSCVAAGYTYYLANLRWMMDEVGEWYQDRTTRVLYLKTDGSVPRNNQIVTSVRDYGIHIERQSNLSISNIEIRNTRYESVRIDGSYNYTLDGLFINDSGAAGIWIIAITPSSGISVTNKIVNNRIENVNTIGILAKGNNNEDARIDNGSSTLVEGNVISGVGNWNYANPDASENQKLSDWRYDRSNERGTGISLVNDENYKVDNNVIDNTGYSAINIAGKSLNPVVTRNRITNFCNKLDDGGGIYIGGDCFKASDLWNGEDSRTCVEDFVESGVVSQNIISNGVGNSSGLFQTISKAHGIYLDSDTMGTSVSDNVVYDIEGPGVFIHDASDNTIENNILFDNSVEIRLQENPEGGVPKTVSNNIVNGNTIVHLELSESVDISSSEDNYLELLESARFSSNRYYSPLTKRLVIEKFAEGESKQSTLAQWQLESGQGAGGVQLSEYQVTPYFFTPGAGPDLISNTDFESGTDDWSCWFPDKTAADCPVSAVDPYSVWNEFCDIGDGACMTLSASPTKSIQAKISDLAFVREKAYLLEFVALGDARKQQGSTIVRKADQLGEGWDSLGLNENFSVDMEPEYFHYVFTGLENYTGAEAYIYADPGSKIHIDNYSITPVEISAPVDIQDVAVLLVNDTQRSQSFASAVRRGVLDLSRSYVDIDGMEVSTRDMLLPGESKVIIASNLAHRDADGDGVTESKSGNAYYDRCINTPLNLPADRYGCSFSQRNDWDGDGIPNDVELANGTSPEIPDAGGESSIDGEDPFPPVNTETPTIEGELASPSGTAPVVPGVSSITASTEQIMSIARLYAAAFDRQPKPDGLNYWVNNYENGQPIVKIAGRFVESPEFVAKYGALDDTYFVRQLFRNILGRGVKLPGLTFWVGHLENGVSRAKVLERMSASPENVAKTRSWTISQDLAGAYSAN